MAALLFLDVDGPLLPFGMTAPSGGVPPVRLAAADENPLLDPAEGLTDADFTAIDAWLRPFPQAAPN